MLVGNHADDERGSGTMNFINRLQADNTDLAARLAAVQADITAFRAFLSSDKFTGTESDGSRKDWISTGDVFRILDGISDAAKGGQ